MNPTLTEEAIPVDTATHDQKPVTKSASPHLPAFEPDVKKALSNKESAAQPSLPTSSSNTNTLSSAPITQSITPDLVPHMSSKTDPKQPTTTSPDSVLAKTQTATSKPKIIILHHDTVIDGRRIIVQTIQNCFAAILGTNAPQPTDTAILNAFAHNATLVDALGQLGAFKNLDKLASSSAAGGTGAAAISQVDITKDKSNPNSSKTIKGKGKDKEVTAVPNTPPTQEEKQYEYQHAVALWTHAYLHYTHEFLREFEIYADLEPLKEQMKQQGVFVVILIAQDGLEPSVPEQVSNSEDGEDNDKDGKKQKQQQPAKPAKQPAKGATTITELMRRMGVTAPGKGSRGYGADGRQASASGVVVVDGIYACGIIGREVVRVWKEEILPGFASAQLVKKAKPNNGKGKSKADGKKNAEKDTEVITYPTMQKHEVIFVCSSKQYLGLARAIGATACWVARCEDKGKMIEKHADIVVEDLEKLSRLIISTISESKNGDDKGDQAAPVVDASHSDKKGEAGTTDTKNQAPKSKKAAPEKEDIEMPDAEIPAETSIEQDIGDKMSSPKATKPIKTEPIDDDVGVATSTRISPSTKSPATGTGKKRAREDDDLEEWLPVEIAAEHVPVVDLTEDA
ncbi:hypothetical protein B0T20DRAFT_391805 [Sordaria brevicollis]|uniref:Uncharacterized protein n=1 Tax=Sordaria brevicollis TaxID=83679 RepID=A0AAE0PHY7_SORBR|nr:hypothetical protein B0T20DRAFT_391805 [Sordaria brevicollis]